ncbi:restriction endonuclease subunit S [Shewanella sp. 1CM18E]|uniref:restriction endonuclease subunit S n=1 Tax=Shewanella sp. 1CM18E TaxID=2929169 RepID=UPI0020BD5E9A|nr:restriction endonuclease subunit S [Shewanella sp. 1CM18E]MCK8047170.1 restriction endonuclease subunit S [Shewanella sp. 1CM18E]
MSNLVPEGWRVKTVGELSNVKRGASPRPIKDPKWWGGDVGWVRISDVTSSRKYLRKTTQYLSNEGVRKSVQIAKGEVVLSICATIGRPIIINVDACVHDGFVWFHDLDCSIDREFWYYFLSSKESFLASQRQSGTQGNLNTSIVSDLLCLLPPLPEQQKIAAILTSVDEVIEKTQAQIDKLKDLKTAMMQELLTNGVGTKQGTGDGESYIPHTEFKDSPVGRIPKSWEVLPLSKVAKLERGRFSHRPRNDPAFYNGDIPFLQTGDIPKESPYITKFSQTLNEKGLRVSKLFPAGTLVITIAATIGEIGILEFDSSFPDSLVGIKVNPIKADSMYVLYVMRYLKGELDLLAPQTAQKNINLDILNPFVIPVPPLFEQIQISKSLEAIDGRLNILNLKLSKIQNTKKALMQDLLTGKVRVKLD